MSKCLNFRRLSSKAGLTITERHVHYIWPSLSILGRFKSVLLCWQGEELIEYQLLDDSEIPESVLKSATIQEDESVTCYRMDVIWHYLANLKAVDGSYRFGRISKVAKLLLIIPYSNAEEDFFMIRKNVIPTKPWSKWNFVKHSDNKVGQW